MMIIAIGEHLFPFRTEKLSLFYADGTAMICGRIGSRHYQNGQVTPPKVCPVAFGYKKKEKYDEEEFLIVVDWIEDSVYYEESTLCADFSTRFSLYSSRFPKLV